MTARAKVLVTGLVAALALAVPVSANATTGTFTSTGGPATLPAAGPPGYPWDVVVSGLPGLTDDVNLTLTGLDHSRVSDIDALLVPPNGGSGILFMSDAGDATDIAGVNLVFDDAAAGLAPAPLVSGTYKPTNNDGGDLDAFIGPAPAGPYGATLGAANGLNPNGTWSLYLSDDDATVDVDEGAGSLASYSLTVSTNSSGQPPTGTNPNAGPKPKKAKKAKKCKHKHPHTHGKGVGQIKHNHKHKCNGRHHRSHS